METYRADKIMMSVDGENSFLRHHIPITTPLVIGHREDLDIVHGLKPNVMNVAAMSLQRAHHLQSRGLRMIENA